MAETVRDMLIERERQTLSPRATKSYETKGRVRPIPPCSVRTEFQRDRDRIIHCKSFRRLMHKTQVFLSPEADHYRTRLTHTLEVTQIGRTVARALRLNEDLTEAAALGHDLGHTPFGHAGERVLRKLFGEGFNHNEQSIRVVEKLENGGRGLNLTEEVRDGILHHTGGSGEAFTPEGSIILFADRIAYINHDIDDACRAGILSEEEIPAFLRKTLGSSHGERIDTMTQSVIRASENSDKILMEPEIAEATKELTSRDGCTVRFIECAKNFRFTGGQRNGLCTVLDGGSVSTWH
jgi:dGTPase